MSKTLITDLWGERILLDSDSIAAIILNKSNVLMLDVEGYPIYGSFVYLNGGASINIGLSLEDLMAKLYGCDLVEDKSDLD